MRLRAGTSVVVSGMPGEYMGQLQFTHPEILTVAPVPAGAGAGLEGYARGAASGLSLIHISTRYHARQSVMAGIFYICRATVPYMASGLGWHLAVSGFRL